MKFPEDAEYNTLRAEILNETALQTNLWIAMCTIVVALLTFALDDPENSSMVFYAVYVVILPFRLLIQTKQHNILRISAYLIVNYEEKYTNLKWEQSMREIRKELKKIHQGKSLFEKIKLRVNFIKKEISHRMACVLGIITAIMYHVATKMENPFDPFIIIGTVLLVFVDLKFWDDGIRANYKEAFENLTKGKVAKQ